MPAARGRAHVPRRKRPANRAHGELVLTLGGQDFLLRPTHAAVLAIEEDLDLTSAEIAARAATNRLKTREIGAIVAEFIRAGAAEGSLDAHVNDDKVTELVADRGVIGLYPVIRDLFLEIITGGRDPEGNAKPAEMTSPSLPESATAG